MVVAVLIERHTSRDETSHPCDVIGLPKRSRLLSRIKFKDEFPLNRALLILHRQMNVCVNGNHNMNSKNYPNVNILALFLI